MFNKNAEITYHMQNQQIYNLEKTIFNKMIVSMSKFLDKEDKSVMDIGAGDMHYKSFLYPGVHYIPVDNKIRCPETIVCDLNKKEFPSVYVDVIVCADVLEYVQDHEWFMNKAAQYAKKILISYRGLKQSDSSILYTKDIIAFMQKKGFYITKRNNELKENYSLIACFEKMTSFKLEKNLACTGCGGCANICPSNAIDMKYDSFGFLKPFIIENKCIHCEKCVKTCPVLKNIEKEDIDLKCYAAWAYDEIREKSSSGGVFSVAADYVIKKGGCVFGAAWAEGYLCEHRGITEESDLSALRYSKYVQSNTKSTFQEVRALIKDNRLVAYFGCPCQIAGLNSYLGDLKSSQYLITFDLICFGVPSNVLFQKYLNENYDIKTIKDVTFRDKNQGGWSHEGYKITLKNGKVLYPSYKYDSYQQAFHNVLLRNSVCEDCKFTGFPRQGDLTIGDFWGVDQHDQSWSDKKGTSVIFENSDKGKLFLESINKGFQRIEAVPIGWALDKGNRLLNNGSHGHIRRGYLGQLLKSKPFNIAVNWALHDIHEVGVVCCMNHNMGNNLTNYALYQYLSDLSYTVLLIDLAKDINSIVKKKYKQGDMFLCNPYPEYNITNSYYDKDAINELNQKCQFFVLGSDQLLRSTFIEGTDFSACMDWVNSSKYKLSYASSFGVDYFEGSLYLKEKTNYFLNRFQKISVSEKSGVKLLRESFNLKSEQVLDPVFLCNISHYQNMQSFGKFRLPYKLFVGAYLLDPSEDKAFTIKRVSEIITVGEHLAILDEKYLYDYTFKEALNILTYPKIEELLALIKNCEFFITDSFYGVCFALIFCKQFSVIFKSKNKSESERIESILELVGLEERYVNNYEELIEKELLIQKINYKQVKKILENKVEESKNWLHNALQEQKEFIGGLTSYDIFMEKNIEINKALKPQIIENYRLRNELFILRKKQIKIFNNIKKEGFMEIVGWGAGDCFVRNYDLISKFYNLKWICDTNPDKWDKEIIDGVMCISPSKLKEMAPALVIIMVDSTLVSFNIVNQLLELGITTFDHIENWLKYVIENN